MVKNILVAHFEAMSRDLNHESCGMVLDSDAGMDREEN